MNINKKNKKYQMIKKLSFKTLVNKLNKL